MRVTSSKCHSRESGNPIYYPRDWIPACAGMTMLLLMLWLSLSSPRAQAEAISFWAALPEPDHAEMSALVDQYNQQHHSRSVEYKNFASRSDLLEALEGKENPNLALIDSTWIGELKSKLVPGEDLLLRAGDMVRAVAKSDTFKPVWQTCVIEDKAYAIPFSAETAALVLNPHYFKKVPKVTTVAQLENAAAKVEKGPVNVAPIVLSTAWEKPELGKLWTAFAAANARKQLFFKKPKEQRPFTLLDEATTLNLWWNLVNRSKLLAVPGSLRPDEFIRGAMWILLPRDVESLAAKSVVEPLPKVKRAWSFLRVDALAFFDDGRAWDFANYLTDYPQLKAWSMKTPTVPVNKQVYLSPDYLQDVDARRPWLRTYIAAINQTPKDLGFSEDQFESVGETVLKTLGKELKVQDGALKIHQSLFGMTAPEKP